MRPTFLAPALIAALLAACSSDSPTGVSTAPRHRASPSKTPGSAIDISGVWHSVDHTFITARYDGVITHLACVSESVMTITQNGDEFTGTFRDGGTGSCTTQDGVVIPTPWPSEATLAGRITGLAFHFDQYDAPPNYPVHCPASGTIEVTNNQAVVLNSVGRCDLKFTGIRPIVARSYSSATRQ